jgi:hypothetical protein
VIRDCAARVDEHSPLIHGVDFTSAPHPAKTITAASGRLIDGVFCLSALEAIARLSDFEAWLRRPGPWIGGFDFPFGLPREALRDLRWPVSWPELTRHCVSLGRVGLRHALDRHRAARPAGSKFCFRRGDVAAGAHSPLKLVNPPVALMFLEGASRLLAANVSVPGMFAGDPDRVALEAYPGFAVRRLLNARVRVSYKSDARRRQTLAQRRIREGIVDKLTAQPGLFGVRLVAAPGMLRLLRDDARGDSLDAVLCALQAAWGWQRRREHYGLPSEMDPVEGWIVTVPPAAQPAANPSGPTGL